MQTNLNYNEQMASYMHLAKTKWRSLIEMGAKKGHSLIETAPTKAALVAQLLENTQRFQAVNEDVRTANIGSFDKFVFPMIRTIYPNLIASEVVSVQPMSGPQSMIFFVDAKYDSTKSPAAAGESAVSPLTGHAPTKDFTAELLQDVLVGTGDGATTAFGGTFATHLPIRRNSVVIKAGAITATDDGNGGLVGTGIASGSINYNTGVITALTFSVAPANAVPILMDFRYVMEGNATRPKFGIDITAASVIAETRSLETDWSVEAETDLMALHGINAREMLLGLVAEQLRYEIDRHIIADLYTLASANPGNLTWDYTPGAGVDYYLHQLSFLSVLAQARNTIFYDTRGLGEANFAIVGTNFATVVEALPQFKRVDYGTATGAVFIGEIAGIRFFKDPWLPKDVGILGYKGNDWLRSGYVYAPYVPLWRTPVVTLTDMNRRAALMTRYGTKVINRAFYMLVTIQNFGVV